MTSKLWSIMTLIGWASLFAACGLENGEGFEDQEQISTTTQALVTPGLGDFEASCDNGPPLWEALWLSPFSGRNYSLEALVSAWGIQLNGLTAKKPCLDDYLSLILDMPQQGNWSGLEKTSGCALTVAGLWRAFGIDEPEIWGRYNGKIEKNLEAIGRRYGAYSRIGQPGVVTPSAEELFTVGNVVGVMINAVNTHYFTVVSPPVFDYFKNGWWFTGINGGGNSLDNTSQAIWTRPMFAQLINNQWQVQVTNTTLVPQWTRRLNLWIATHKIPRSKPVHAPTALPSTLDLVRINPEVTRGLISAVRGSLGQ